MAVTKFTQHELNQLLNVQTNSASKLSPIWTAEWEVVSSLKSVYGEFNLKDDIWIIDKHRIGGARTKDSNRTIKYDIIDNSDYADKDGVKRRLKRIVWIYIHQAKGTLSTKVKNVQTFLQLVNTITPLVILHVHNPEDDCPDGPVLFNNIIGSDYEELMPSSTARNGVHVLEQVANQIDDVFRFSPKTYSQLQAEKNKEISTTKIVKKGALTDFEATKLLKQALYFSSLTDLAVEFEKWSAPHRAAVLANPDNRDGVFEIQKKDPEHPKWLANKHKNGKEIYQNEFHQDKKKQLIDMGLIGENGDFLFSFGKNNLHTNFDAFSPRSNTSLVAMIEISHRLLLAFFTGMRDQELFALQPECLLEVRDNNYAEIMGFDFKNSDAIDGDERTWPLPKTCIKIVEQQQQLRTTFFSDSNGLFKTTYAGSVPTASFARNIDLDKDYLLKRMRPTIASLVMLASRSPLAVKAVLGHTEFEQTMGYAKSRKTLQQDLIAQDSRINKALGSKIFDAVKTGNAPVKLATSVLETSARFVGSDKLAKKARSIVDKYDIDDFAELLELFGDNLDSVEEHLGEQFDFVNSFTLCGAKRSDFNGACSATPGVKNPSNCKSNCKYRQDLHQNLNYRAKQVEILIEDIADFEPDEPSYYQRVNQLLDFVWGFEGPLEKYKSDLRIQAIVYALDESDERSEVRKKLAPNARQSLAQIMGEAA